MWGGGVHGSPSPKCYHLPIYNFISYLITTELDTKMVSIIAFSNYEDVKQTYVNKIWQTYIVTRHIKQVFARVHHIWGIFRAILNI